MAGSIGSQAAAPSSEQLRLQMEWDKRMGVTNNAVRYDRTAVLLLYWDKSEDDLEISEEVNQLRKVFEDDYKFTVHEVVLNTTRSPALQAKKALTNFVEQENDRNTLLIVYYAGHGYSEVDDESGNIKLIGNLAHGDKDSIDWLTVEWSLKGTDADVLIIFDCCHAGLLCEPYERSRPEVCFQVLAACERHHTTRKAGPYSFTSALIWALGQLKDQRSFSTLGLKTMIRKAPKFPKDQIPQLSFRMGNSRPECIHIARMVGQEEDCPPSPIEDIRRQQYLDVRLHFSEELTYQKVLETCDALKVLKSSDMGSMRHIALIGKNRMAPHVEKAASMVQDAWLEFKRRRDRQSITSLDVHQGMQRLLPPSPTHSPAQCASSASSTLSPSFNEETPLLLTAKSPEPTSDEQTSVRYHFHMLMKGLGEIFMGLLRRMMPRIRQKPRKRPDIFIP